MTSHTSEEQVTVLSINNYAKQFYVFISDRVGVRVVIGVVKALMTIFSYSAYDSVAYNQLMI